MCTNNFPIILIILFLVASLSAATRGEDVTELSAVAFVGGNRVDALADVVAAVARKLDFGGAVALTVIGPGDKVIDGAIAIGVCHDRRAAALFAFGPDGVRLAAAAALVRLGIRAALHHENALARMAVDTPTLYLDAHATAANVLAKWYVPVPLGGGRVFWAQVSDAFGVVAPCAERDGTVGATTTAELVDAVDYADAIFGCAGGETIRWLREREDAGFFDAIGAPLTPMERATEHLARLAQMAPSTRAFPSGEAMLRAALCVDQKDAENLGAAVESSRVLRTAEQAADVLGQSGTIALEVVATVLIGWQRLAALCLEWLFGGKVVAVPPVPMQGDNADARTVALSTAIVSATFATAASLLFFRTCSRCRGTPKSIKKI